MFCFTTSYGFTSQNSTNISRSNYLFFKYFFISKKPPGNRTENMIFLNFLMFKMCILVQKTCLYKNVFFESPLRETIFCYFFVKKHTFLKISIFLDTFCCFAKLQRVLVCSKTLICNYFEAGTQDHKLVVWWL